MHLLHVWLEGYFNVDFSPQLVQALLAFLKDKVSSNDVAVFVCQYMYHAVHLSNIIRSYIVKGRVATSLIHKLIIVYIFA